MKCFRVFSFADCNILHLWVRSKKQKPFCKLAYFQLHPSILRWCLHLRTLLDWLEALMFECQVSAQDFSAALGMLGDTQLMMVCTALHCTCSCSIELIFWNIIIILMHPIIPVVIIATHYDICFNTIIYAFHIGIVIYVINSPQELYRPCSVPLWFDRFGKTHL